MEGMLKTGGRLKERKADEERKEVKACREVERKEGG